MKDLSFIEHLNAQGFTHVSFDMASAVSIAAWRKSERKTYSVYGARSLEEARDRLLAQMVPPPADLFSDILG